MFVIAVLWVVLALVAAWGSLHFARRDPRPTTWMKMGIAGCLLSAAGTAHLWLRGDIVGEGLLGHFLLLAFWALTVFGVPLCLGSIVGALAGMYKRAANL
ncbi:hypothetical protein IVB18_05815 [Bradyrhizobium sp. 186]|uniref:hypothetical protein n=1 Tax=Bradyrhizobium sp. 186 TaxID=2782654 RepID=UPI002000E04C|nr:hypothetical protein [Bradyrhizobium sp. 186]UPK36863.1 hypothetical protein IVB18_05815 [Bradyrhizobium sp. 186]